MQRLFSLGSGDPAGGDAASCTQSLIPTTAGSARAIGLIFPELQGNLNGHAVRVPLLNASLTDAVFELERSVTVEEVNGAFQSAANGELQGILGYEERPLVSVDYVNDGRSAIVDGLSTLVVNGTQLKVYAWYDTNGATAAAWPIWPGTWPPCVDPPWPVPFRRCSSKAS